MIEISFECSILYRLLLLMGAPFLRSSPCARRPSFQFNLATGSGFSTRISSSIGALPLSLPRLLERLFMQIPLQISFETAESSGHPHPVPSSIRSTAGLGGFLILTHARHRPER